MSLQHLALNAWGTPMPKAVFDYDLAKIDTRLKRLFWYRGFYVQTNLNGTIELAVSFNPVYPTWESVDVCLPSAKLNFSLQQRLLSEIVKIIQGKKLVIGFRGSRQVGWIHEIDFVSSEGTILDLLPTDLVLQLKW